MKVCRMNNSRNIGPQYLMGSVKTAVREYCCITSLTFFYFFINTCKYFSWKEVVLQPTSIATKWICQAIASSSKVLRAKIESMTKKNVSLLIRLSELAGFNTRFDLRKKGGNKNNWFKNFRLRWVLIQRKHI